MICIQQHERFFIFLKPTQFRLEPRWPWKLDDLIFNASVWSKCESTSSTFFFLRAVIFIAKYLWEFGARESIRTKTRKAISRNKNISAREIKYSRDRCKNGKRAKIAEGCSQSTLDYKNEHNSKIIHGERQDSIWKRFWELLNAFESFICGITDAKYSRAAEFQNSINRRFIKNLFVYFCDQSKFNIEKKFRKIFNVHHNFYQRSDPQS